MNKLTLTGPGGPLRGTAQLPASKSESNRALILQALAGGGQLDNLSDANDTVLMRRLLAAAPGTDQLDAEDAGTVMRFLTAYLAVTDWRGTLTGSARMQQRPIGVLVDALRQLGARIEYAGRDAFPPLQFGGFRPAPTADNQTPELTVRGDISSQYISALLMVAPLLPTGLRLRLTGRVGSRPYIELTLALMRHFGARAEMPAPDAVAVLPGRYRPADYAVEADWSAASYWYALVALAAPGTEIELPGLRERSLQGDQRIAEIMAPFGVETRFAAGAVRLRRVTEPVAETPPACDFAGCPDLAQTVAAVAAARQVRLVMTGLESLRIKETDRIAALQTELAKFGAALIDLGEGRFRVRAENFAVRGQTVATYHDHRMAMAFAPLALLGPLAVENPDVVRKSYPSFWQELTRVGFSATS